MKATLTFLFFLLNLFANGQEKLPSIVYIPKCDTVNIPSISDNNGNSRAIHGVYKKCNQDSLYFIATYKNGVLNGSFKKYVRERHDNCNHIEGVHTFIESGEYVNGKREGEWLITGKFKKIISNYENGKLNGEFTEYLLAYDDYILSKCGLYTDGLETGRWLFYSDIGAKRVIHFKEGIRHGEYTRYAYWDSTDVVQKGEYRNGKKEGEWTDYTLNPYKTLPVYEDDKIISYRITEFQLKEEAEKKIEQEKEKEQLTLKIILVAIALILVIISGTIIGWKRIFSLCSALIRKPTSAAANFLFVSKKTAPKEIEPSLKTWLIVTTSIFGGLTLLSMPMLPYTVMIFDSPGSYAQLAPYMLAFGFLSFPLATILGITVGWATAKTSPTIAKVFSSLPFLSILIFFIGILSL